MKRRIEKTDFILTAIKTYTSVITVGNSYELYIDYNNHFPNGEEFVYGDNGEMITTLCFKSIKTDKNMKITKLNKKIKITSREITSVTIGKEYQVFLIKDHLNFRGEEHILNDCGLYVTLNCVEFVII